MRILICGGREFANQEKFDRAMEPFKLVQLEHKHFDGEPLVVIHGACGWPGPFKGADGMADKWAKSLGLEPVTYEANWIHYGNAAGPIRNEQMLRLSRPNWVIAFPGGTGTRNMVELTRVAIRAGAKITLAEIF